MSEALPRDELLLAIVVAIIGAGTEGTLSDLLLAAAGVFAVAVYLAATFARRE